MTTPGSRWALHMTGPGSQPDPFESAPGHAPGAVQSVPELLAAAKECEESKARLTRIVKGFSGRTTMELIGSVGVTADPLVLWALHLELDRRNIPPCMRWPANESTAQAEFITLLADLLWFCKRHPGHRARFKGWQGLVNVMPASRTWHGVALRQFRFVVARYSVAHWCAKGLALTEAQRQPLMVLQTNTMRADRRLLHPARFNRAHQALLSAALARPDKAGVRTAEQVANRRAYLWRTYILAGRSATRAVTFWRLLSGEELARQALEKQIAKVNDLRRELRRNDIDV
jgi:hypothetical protein